MKFDLSIEPSFETFAYIEYQNLHRNIYTLDKLYSNMKSYIDNYLKFDLNKEIENELLNIGKRPIEDEEAEIIIQAVWGSKTVSFESLNIYSQYMIVAMYSFFEKSIKEIIKLFIKHKFKNKDILNINKNFNIDIFKEFLKTIGINFKDIKSYNNIDIIRKLSYKIKHESNEIHNIYSLFTKYKNGPVDFLYDLNKRLAMYDN